MTRTKPKTNRAGDIGTSNSYDKCQTPAYALLPLVRNMARAGHGVHYTTIWEPMSGEGNLAKGLDYWRASVTATDILTGHNYFTCDIPKEADFTITNPPFSIKYKCLARAYEIGMPFAFLMPVDTIGAASAQRLFDKHGIQIIYMSPRINFKMPSHRNWDEATWATSLFDETGAPVWLMNKDGSYKLDTRGERIQKKTTGAQFPTAWFCWDMGFASDIIFETIERKLMIWEQSSAGPES